MSIATAITDLSNRIQNAYDVCETKGATIPTQKTTWNLSSTIESIPTGGGGEIFGLKATNLLGNNNGMLVKAFDDEANPGHFATNGISSLGDALTYFFADNNNLRSASFPDMVKFQSTIAHGFDHAFANCTNLSSVSFPVLSGLSRTNTYPFHQAFINCSNLQKVDFSGLSSLPNGLFASSANTLSAFLSAFANCTSLSSVDFSQLATLGGTREAFNHAFANCTNLKDVSFSALSSLESRSQGSFGYAFLRCTNLSSVDFSGLKTIKNSIKSFENTFESCTHLSSVTFSQLSYISCTADIFNAFTKNSKIQSLYFPELTEISCSGTGTAFTMFNTDNVSNIYFNKLSAVAGDIFNTTGYIKPLVVHFAIENQAAIEACDKWSNKFGLGVNQTIVFDL